MARVVRAALAISAGLAALVGGATTANAAEKTYIQLQTEDSSLCLGASSNDVTYLDLCRTDWPFPAVWEVVPTAGSSFELRWDGNGSCLEVANSGTQAGANVRLGTCSGGKQTRWQMDLVDPVRKLYQLRPTHTQDRCLDVPNSEMVLGNSLQQWTCNQSAAQLWHVKQLPWPSA